MYITDSDNYVAHKFIFKLYVIYVWQFRDTHSSMIVFLLRIIFSFVFHWDVFYSFFFKVTFFFNTLSVINSIQSIF